jgi:hypothetical protein
MLRFGITQEYESNEDPAVQRQREEHNQELRKVSNECRQYARTYGHLKDRAPAIYSPERCVNLGLRCGLLWTLGTHLHELLHGKREPPTPERLPPVRRMLGPQGRFATSDELLLFCLDYWVAGLSQQQLAEQHECSQGLISRYLATSLPYFRAAVRLCCTQDHRERLIISTLKEQATANRPPQQQGRRQRGPIFNLAADIDC